jgi:membrane-bound lytic murein transglycosylase B
MRATRRAVLLGMTALGLSGCVGGGGGGGAVVSRGPEPGMTPVANAGWDAWVAGFKGRAAGRGISGGTLDVAFRDAGFLPGVIEKDRNQTEFTRSLEDYLAIAASDERVTKGRAAMRTYGGVLAEIEARFGVEANVVAAVWGLESFYGERRGSIEVISALSTLAYDGRRGEFFEGQLVAALKILQNGDTTPSRMVGSWAGAMGHTQFIPTSYLAYAVDFRGDGRRDIWDNDPTDALASTANYFNRSGWTKGQPWGVEVRLPAGFNTGQTGRGTTRSPADWAAQGVRDMNGRAVPDYGAASILIPAGAGGPAFMVFRNFTVITRYNNAESYVIGIGHLSDRLAGGPPIQASFGPDKNGMTIADRQELQRRLTAAGFDTGGADGVIGKKTEAAISAYQASRGMAVTGQPSMALLQALR